MTPSPFHSPISFCGLESVSTNACRGASLGRCLQEIRKVFKNKTGSKVEEKLKLEGEA